MRNPKLGKSLLASAIGLAMLAGFTPSAGAADTTATFTVTAGALSILPPAAAALGAAAPGATATPVAFGPVVVTDLRAALNGAWTATVSSGDFTTTGEGAPTVGKANVSYWSGPSIAPTGTATRTAGQAAAENAVTLAATRTAFTASGVTGVGTTTWNPTVSVAIPGSAVAGAYTGTITHSVA